MEAETVPILPFHWLYLPTLLRLGLATGSGIFVGLEREHNGKAGARTFAFAALLGCLGGLMSQGFAMLSLGLVTVLVIFMNWRQLAKDNSLALTTSAALLLVAFAGVLCGQGHTFTPVAVTAITAALLAWKQPLTGFATGLTEKELRSAILLTLLSFVVYPVLPEKAVDPWALIDPRSTWATVILIAALGFVNYILWKIYGSRGAEITGFLGGLVNSTAAVAELACRVREAVEGLIATAYRGVLLATAAMLLRNALLLAFLSVGTLQDCTLPLVLMFVVSGVFAWRRLKAPAAALADEAGAPTLKLESPFSLGSALKFGFIFLILQVAGTLGQRYLGTLGFYAVSIAGGLFSSASAVASAGTLAAHGKLALPVAANGVVLAALTSALVNLPLIARVGRQRRLTMALARVLVVIAAVGLIGVALQDFLLRH
jgi:uncharacterized membrane protein (DUF4010 family)